MSNEATYFGQFIHLDDLEVVSEILSKVLGEIEFDVKYSQRRDDCYLVTFPSSQEHKFWKNDKAHERTINKIRKLYQIIDIDGYWYVVIRPYEKDPQP